MAFRRRAGGCGGNGAAACTLHWPLTAECGSKVVWAILRAQRVRFRGFVQLHMNGDVASKKPQARRSLRRPAIAVGGNRPFP